MATSIRDFLTSRSGKRATDTVTIDGREIPVQSLSYREKSEVHLMWWENGKDTRDDAHQLRQALLCSRAILEADGKRAFTDDEKDLKILIELMGADMDLLNEGVKKLSFAEADKLAKNLPAPKTNAS